MNQNPTITDLFTLGVDMADTIRQEENTRLCFDLSEDNSFHVRVYDSEFHTLWGDDVDFIKEKVHVGITVLRQAYGFALGYSKAVADGKKAEHDKAEAMKAAAEKKEAEQPEVEF